MGELINGRFGGRDPDGVFVWPVGFGRVLPHSRDTATNGKPVPYRPDLSGEGVLWARPDASAPVDGGRGPRLGVQGSISRMALFHWGHVTHGWIVALDVAGRDVASRGVASRYVASRGDIGRLRSAAEDTLTEGLGEWWAPAVVGRGRGYGAAVALSTPEAARHTAEQLGVSTLLRVDDDVDVTIGWGDTAHVVTENLFVCDLDGHVLSALAAPATFRTIAVPAALGPR